MAETRDWDEIRHLVLQRWPALDEQAVKETDGDREAILALLEVRLGYARANAERDYDELLSGESSVAAKDLADENQHTGTSGPVGDVHGSFDAAGREHADQQARGGSVGEQVAAGADDRSARGVAQGSEPKASSDAETADEYAEGEQGAALLNSDNSDSKTVPPDMQRDERGEPPLRRAG
jgi:hypothetical protein